MRSLPERGQAAVAPRRRVRAAWRAALFLLATATLLPLFLLAGLLGRPAKRLVRVAWCRACQGILGLVVDYRGEPMGACATLYVANHVSYLDIVLLGARIDATFIAKAEVGGWPLFGLISRAANTFFIRRSWRDALLQRNVLAARMRAGESFILFAEGTSTDGLDVLPFKTSLLSVAEPWVIDRPIAVQPVALVFRALRDGQPIGPLTCGRYAWFGDDSMLPHLWAVLQDDGLFVEVTFGEPVISWAVDSRKTLGRKMRETVRHEVVGARRALREEIVFKVAEPA